MFRSLLFGSLFLFLVVSSVNAQNPGKKRGLRQHQRIEQGVKSGNLTPEEAKALKDEQQNIREMKKDAKADGVVTPEEKQKIKQARDAASQHIYQEKHDSEKVAK